MGISYCIFVVAFLYTGAMAYANLSPNFYASSCPDLLSTVQDVVCDAVSKETRAAASLLRLHFHDCFVQGCDASVLLDDTSTFTGEKTSVRNAGSLRRFDIIDEIKKQVECICPGVVSCADILALAARDSVVALGGPTWTVPLGRRDSKTASLRLANSDIAPGSFNLGQLISNFAKQGLNLKDLVVLSGAHTIGLARCVTFRGRIYNDTNINPSFARALQVKCPRVGNNNTLQQLDLVTPDIFDNSYYKNLQTLKGLLHSDQALLNGDSADSLSETYAADTETFFADFAQSMIKMGNIKVLTGSQGEVRTNCRKVN
ncbi:hypothetical protein AMTRI_Chr08g167780 [Amborella trichopoda]